MKAPKKVYIKPDGRHWYFKNPKSALEQVFMLGACVVTKYDEYFQISGYDEKTQLFEFADTTIKYPIEKFARIIPMAQYLHFKGHR